MKKIILWCKRHNIPYTVQDIKHGKQRIQITIEGDYSEYSTITSQLYKVSHRNRWTIDTHINTKTIWIYNTAGYEYIKAINDNMSTLVNLFFTSLQAGKTQDEAKQIQHEYAVKNGMETAYNDIYNR